MLRGGCAYLFAMKPPTRAADVMTLLQANTYESMLGYVCIKLRPQGLDSPLRSAVTAAGQHLKAKNC